MSGAPTRTPTVPLRCIHAPPARLNAGPSGASSSGRRLLGEALGWAVRCRRKSLPLPAVLNVAPIYRSKRLWVLASVVPGLFGGCDNLDLGS